MRCKAKLIKLLENRLEFIVIKPELCCRLTIVKGQNVKSRGQTKLISSQNKLLLDTQALCEEKLLVLALIINIFLKK